MSKWTRVKVLLAFVVVVGAITFVAYEEKQASIKYQRECYEHGSPVFSRVPEKNGGGTNECEDAKEYMPWWYVLITWPQGITTWAIIVTGLVIGWQSYETRRSVYVNLRPRLLIRGIEVLPPNSGTGGALNDIVPARHLTVGVANAGGSEAQVVNSSLSFVRETKFSDGQHIVLPTFPPYDPNGATFGTFTIRAGEHTQRAIKLDDSMSFTLMLVDSGKTNSPVVTADLFCFGFMEYKDRLDISRRTGFAFRYNIGENRFNRMDNPDYNYQD